MEIEGVGGKNKYFLFQGEQIPTNPNQTLSRLQWLSPSDLRGHNLLLAQWPETLCLEHEKAQFLLSQALPQWLGSWLHCLKARALQQEQGGDVYAFMKLATSVGLNSKVSASGKNQHWSKLFLKASYISGS